MFCVVFNNKWFFIFLIYYWSFRDIVSRVRTLEEIRDRKEEFPIDLVKKTVGATVSTINVEIRGTAEGDVKVMEEISSSSTSPFPPTPPTTPISPLDPQ